MQWTNESQNFFLEYKEINAKEKRKVIKFLTRFKNAYLVFL